MTIVKMTKWVKNPLLPIWNNNKKKNQSIPFYCGLDGNGGSPDTPVSHLLLPVSTLPLGTEGGSNSGAGTVLRARILSRKS